MRKNVPNPAMQPHVDAYIDHGHPVGSFLFYLFANNLALACANADETNRKLIFEWARWLWNEAPASCWGSEDKVRGWQDAHWFNNLERERNRIKEDKPDATNAQISLG